MNLSSRPGGLNLALTSDLLYHLPELKKNKRKKKPSTICLEMCFYTLLCVFHLNMSLIRVWGYLVEAESEHTWMLLKKGFTYFHQVDELGNFACFPEVGCHI